MKMIQLMLLLLLYIMKVHAQSLTCQVNGGVVSCPPVVCPGDQVTFIGTVAAVASNLWVLPAGTCSGDSIVLPQTVGGCNSTTMTCGPYTATNADPGAANPCLTSTLSVIATSSMTSSVIKVGTRSVGGQNTIVNTTQIMIIAPPRSLMVLLAMAATNELHLTMAPPTTGGVPTSYNVSINDSSSPVVIPDNGSSLYTHTFTGLTSDTLYTVSVVAINCAGTSNVTSLSKLTLADPPNSTSINVVFVMYANKTLRHLEITWTPVGGSVTMYTVRVVGNGASVGPTSATCTTSPCLYIQQVYVPATSYTIFVASINGNGAVGPESTTIYDTSINDVISNASYDLRSLSCSFLHNQSFYCVVCCSTDPSVPPDSSVYKIFTSRGTEVTVDLDGLTRGQMYYCKAAATNTTSASCGGPVVGGVKVFFSFTFRPHTDVTTPPTSAPTSPPSTAPPTSTSTDQAAIAVGVVVPIIALTIIITISATVAMVLRRKRFITEVTTAGQYGGHAPGPSGGIPLEENLYEAHPSEVEEIHSQYSIVGPHALDPLYAKMVEKEYADPHSSGVQEDPEHNMEPVTLDSYAKPHKKTTGTALKGMEHVQPNDGGVKDEGADIG